MSLDSLLAQQVLHHVRNRIALVVLFHLSTQEKTLLISIQLSEGRLFRELLATCLNLEIGLSS